MVEKIDLDELMIDENFRKLIKKQIKNIKLGTTVIFYAPKKSGKRTISFAFLIKNLVTFSLISPQLFQCQ